MRLIIQRVTQASVTVSGSVVGAINKGYLVLVGIGQNDTEAIVEKMADKMMRLRIFSDENDKINLSLQDVGGQLLLVSQFTLYADCRKGNRPSLPTASKLFLSWNMAFSEQICKFRCAMMGHLPLCWILTKL